jgi:antitoxin PrlF
MPGTIAVNSTLTDRFQTTVPETVRRALQLGKRDKIQFTIRPDGEVVLTKVDSADEPDAVLENFLAFLSTDMQAYPQRLTLLQTGLAARIKSVVSGVEFDLDAPLSDNDE